MDKKEKIIRTSMKLFVTQGFENTPTSQISKESNVGTGTLFYYFENKEQLINEIYKYVKQSMQKSLFVGLDENLDVKKQIKILWDNLLLWGFENREENVFLNKFYGSVYIDKLTVEEIRSSFERSNELFLKAKKAKLIKNMSKELLERITFSLFNSFMPEFYTKKKFDKKLLKRSFEIYFDAIKK